jgi:hypothetical protein
MKWEKKGLIYRINKSIPWSQSHTQVPVVDSFTDKFRIYFGTRDVNNKSRIGYIDVEKNNPKKIIYVCKKPVLDIGKPGGFDDCGVIPSWIIKKNNKKYLYYVGITQRKTVPYEKQIGLAISEDNGENYFRFSDGPIFSSNYHEPFFTGTSCVLFHNNKWKNWYMSCTEWKKIKNKYEPRYHIKYAESKNGYDWNQKGIVAIDFKSKNEGGIVKANVLIENNLFKMWYSYRNLEEYSDNSKNSYRIGYAESKDGVNWIRKDNMAGINVSNTGWDSGMITYPHVIKYKNKLLMFYNGSGFGKTGIGYAEYVIT